ncbi:MAG: biotin/lipoyl-containing protein [Anaerolineales bacterium]
MKYITTNDDKPFNVEIIDESHVRINKKVLEVDFESVSGQPVYSLLIGGKSHEAYIYPEEKEWQVLLHGRLYHGVVEDEREKRLRAAGSRTADVGGEFQLKAPIPGLVVAVPVSDGQTIKKDQVLVILESMKMQNQLKAPRDGTIARIGVKTGETVKQKQVLLTIV